VSISSGANAVLRAGILRAADDKRVRRFMRRYGMRLGAARFVAGVTLDECIVVLRRLADQGLHANTTLLGEGIRDRSEAIAVAGEYVQILERLVAEQLPVNVALKLTHLGLEIDEEVAYANVERVVRAAERLDSFVRMDMEQSSVVDATLRIYRRLREGGHDRVGTVLQAYLYRTESDLESLLPLRPNLRIVKGAYKEPASVAHGRRPTSTPPTTGWSSDPSRSRHSRRSQRTTSGGSRGRWRSGAGPTGWSSRCSTASGRSSSSTSSARAGGCWSRLPSAPTGTRT
jgi:proline dehydrogenase